MVNIRDYNLIYLRISDGRKFLVKYATKIDMIFLDSVTGEVLRLTQSFARRRYKPDKVANKVNKKQVFLNFGKKFVKGKK
jgi:hypothetical protein